MRYLLSIILLVSGAWGQSNLAHKCGFATIPHAETHVTRSGDRDIPQFDESLLDESIVSPDGHFRVHFTRTGDHAVANAGDSGTPNYVMEAALAADSAYTVLVNNLGFLPPLPDNGIDGDELDVYIRDWNGSYYGMTYFGNSAPSMTYLVIDNDYTESSYATSGLAALRVTIAHEFFHMVQLRYAYPFAPVSSNAYWYEISSTWMEEKCYPGIDDYHAYVEDNFRQTNFPNLNDDRYGFAFSYGHGLFGQILDIEYGTTDGKHIMLDIWEELSGREATDNLDIVLSSSTWNSSLSDALGKYALYNVFTGSRAVNNMYYPDAADLSEVGLHEYALPLTYPIEFDFFMDPFEISFRKFTIPSYSNFHVRGDELTVDQRVLLTYHSFENGSSLKSAIGDYLTLCENVSSLDYLIFPMVNGNRNSDFTYTLTFEGSTPPLENLIQTLWPNPTIPRIAQPQLSFTLAEPGWVDLKIFNLLGQTVYSKRMQRSEGVKLIDLQVPISSPAGFYFVQIETADAVMTRKITVLR
ncbi:MAG: T9SS type A sorting domain-containing protein [FCB group bacterium]|nr:T9SS type A sorting domain-containing protein [FCB group bacterium]MBL7026955.1 T9SS type A sorting domain-containing protein [Candidatus Neomarinimicrobiota bacterium]MBL7120428.1 T9SS type A sorting domain-containing protein [Candidatus Neomarinimicrobiota bacterium]